MYLVLRILTKLKSIVVYQRFILFFSTQTYSILIILNSFNLKHFTTCNKVQFTLNILHNKLLKAHLINKTNKANEP